MAEEIECHFKWKPESKSVKITELENKLLRNIAENPYVKVQAYTLLGYVLTLDCHNYDPVRSKGYFEKALEEAGDADDRRFVAEADLVMNQIRTGTTKELDKRKKELQEKWCKWREEEPQKLAFTYGCQAFALIQFGPKYLEKAIEFYNKAMTLDPKHWNWPFWKAVMLERKRTSHNYEQCPSDNVLGLYEKAMELSHSNEYVTVHYATCLCTVYRLKYNKKSNSNRTGLQSNRGQWRDGRPRSFAAPILGRQHYEGVESRRNDEQTTLKERIRYLLHEAREKAVTNNALSVLLRCCKGFKQMRWHADWKDCCVQMMAISREDDSGVLHEVGQYYFKSDDKDLPRAKELLERSSKSSPRGNIFADVDLIQVRLLLHEDINVDIEYERLYPKYEVFGTDIEILHWNWAHALEMFEDRENQIGCKENLIVFHLKEAIKHKDPTVVQNGRAWQKLEPIYKDIMTYPRSGGGIQYKQACKELAWMYFIPEPKTEPNLETAETYLSKLKEDEFDEEDIELYGQVLFGLKKYEDALIQFGKLEDNNEKKNAYIDQCNSYLEQ